MKKLIFSLFSIITVLAAQAQNDPVTEITQVITKEAGEAHVAFLSADEMRGRKVGTREIDIAANYIISQFKQWGIKPAPNTLNYVQSVDFKRSFVASSIELSIGQQVFKLKDDLIKMDGGDFEASGDIVFVGYGTRTDFEKAKVNGKIVVALSGSAQENTIGSAYSGISAKNALAKEFGAIALVEILTPPAPWQGIVQYFHKTTISLRKENPGIPHIWLKNTDVPAIAALKKDKKASGSLKISGARLENFQGKNIAGVVEGTDPVLKNEYLVISSHYDHVGVINKPDQTDSIYNGARDNAIGTTGMLSTAYFFSKYPQKRSVLFLAVTAEESGLLGSAWYSEHPLIPLKQTVFDFNCDGTGYNDKTITTVIGLERTTAEPEIYKACEAFGLKPIVDPVPEQNLFERSDNYNFAKKGVPAINFAPGAKSFDAEIFKYYHQAADEIGTLDFDYLIKYFRSYVYTNYLLANMPKAPAWKAGDKFEAESKKLYSK